MVAVAASPTPGAAAGPAFSAKSNEHPPYKDMIFSAIEALKDRKGSSRIAISKYIADNYTGLPSTHAALLTHHLRRLQHRGDLTMFKHSFKLSNSSAAAGSKKRGRPPKNAPKRRGRPPNLAAHPPPAEKKRESARPPKLKTPAAVDPASVYILPQAEQLKSGFLQSLPGAVAIILPEGLLSKKTARSPVIILPNGVQSLVEASAAQKKPGRPRKDLIQKKKKKQPDHPKEPEKIQPFPPRRKAVVPKQLLLHDGHTSDDNPNAAVKKPGRPRKSKNSNFSENPLPKPPVEKPNSPGSESKKKAARKNSVFSENSLSKLPNARKPAAEKLAMAKIVQNKPNSPGSELKKKPFGQLRKTSSSPSL